MGNEQLLKKYKLGFDIQALLLFLIIMIPNFIWFAVPAPNDILRADSATGFFDTIASICQILMFAMLCMLHKNRRKKVRVTPLTTAAGVCCLLYFASWAFYYTGATNTIVLLGLTLPPCLAFLFFAIDRNNLLAVIPISIFTVCHLIYGAVNFMI